MAGPAPKTRNWQAIENAHKPKGLHVLVYGLVEMNAANMEPRLSETAERNPRNLGLNLTIEKSGAGPDVKCWKAAHFHKEVKANQYDNVVVRWDVGQIANIPVLDDREEAQQAAAAMTALNQKYAGKVKSTKPAATKPAPKRPAPKKTAQKKTPKSVGGWAKSKKAKKAPKKASRKAPKKAAKRSGLKKLVRRIVKTLTPAKKKKR
jgi:hypothetical protein